MKDRGEILIVIFTVLLSFWLMLALAEHRRKAREIERVKKEMIAQVEAQNKALEEMVAISSNLVWQSRHPIAAERKE